MRKPKTKNLKTFLPVVILTLLIAAATTLAACAPSVETPATPPVVETPSVPTLPQAKVKIFEQAGSDPWRDYSFEPASFKTWTNEEGDEILDVWVRIDYKNNPGTAVRDEQQWHIDFKNNRYKVSDSFSYDADGNFCET